MNETLILLADATPDDPVQWAFVGEDGVNVSDRSDNAAGLAAIAERAGAARAVACILRGETATMRALPVPPKSTAQFRSAASMLLEDELAENLEQVHVATARHDSGAGVALAIKKSEIDAWLTALSDAGLSPDIITVDYALTPMTPGRAVIIEAPDRLFGVVGLRGFAVDKPIAGSLLPSLLNDDDLRKVVFCTSPAFVTEGRDGLEVEPRGRMDVEALFGFIAEGLDKAPNLRHGAYRKRRDWRMAIGPWRRVGVLAAASVAALMLVNMAVSTRDMRTADQLKEETRALHDAVFPDAAGADPRQHARQILAAGGGRPVFLALTNSLAEAVDENDGVEIDRIRYNAARGDYSVNLHFVDIAQFEAFKRALASRGLSAAETGGVVRAGAFYRGQLQVNFS